ncbi:hypothetical protein D046_3025C, partial [Vibrio parahaemolyticus V-223/04]
VRLCPNVGSGVLLAEAVAAPVAEPVVVIFVISKPLDHHTAHHGWSLSSFTLHALQLMLLLPAALNFFDEFLLGVLH